MRSAILDHVVVDVRDEVDRAVEAFGNLGFSLTARGYHTLGSVNHLAVLESNYLELLGWERENENVRADIARFPIGLGGLVFRTDDADRLFAELRADGIPALEPQAFSRPVSLPDGRRENARFQTVRFPPEAFPGPRIYFCRHLTPELVWRDEYRTHPNGARDIVSVRMPAANPPAYAALVAQLFKDASVVSRGDGCVLHAENAQIEFVNMATKATLTLRTTRPERKSTSHEALNVVIEFTN